MHTYLTRMPTQARYYFALATLEFDHHRSSLVLRDILSKVHVHRRRYNTIIPCISPIAPIEWRSPSYIIYHPSEQAYLPPLRDMLAPHTRTCCLPVFSMSLSTSGAKEIEAMLPRLAWGRLRIVQGVLKSCGEGEGVGVGVGSHCVAQECVSEVVSFHRCWVSHGEDGRLSDEGWGR